MNNRNFIIIINYISISSSIESSIQSSISSLPWEVRWSLHPSCKSEAQEVPATKRAKQFIHMKMAFDNARLALPWSSMIKFTCLFHKSILKHLVSSCSCKKVWIYTLLSLASLSLCFFRLGGFSFKRFWEPLTQKSTRRVGWKSKRYTYDFTLWASFPLLPMWSRLTLLTLQKWNTCQYWLQIP